MKRGHLYWQNENGKLELDRAECTWRFGANDGRNVYITTWEDSRKGPMTEVVLEYNGKDIIIELLKKNSTKNGLSQKCQMKLQKTL